MGSYSAHGFNGEGIAASSRAEGVRIVHCRGPPRSPPAVRTYSNTSGSPGQLYGGVDTSAFPGP
jgi:hypothetical protein